MTPKDELELSGILAAATSPVEVRGGGTRPVGHMAGDILSTSGITGIVDYEPGALTLIAKAGTPVAEIEATLAAEGQRLAFEPPDWRALLGTEGASTIGGVVAANASGPRRVQVGACRDFMLGVRFVDGRGQVIKNGGRVMKNVTGYDLVKLMAGSWGTLGVLTEVAFKVLPQPETQATLVGACETPIAAMQAALISPFEVTGAASRGNRVFLRLEGFEDQVSYRLGKLQDLLKSFGQWEVEEIDWAAIASAAMVADKPVVWRISIVPSLAENVRAALPPGEVLLDQGGGLMWYGTDGVDLKTHRIAKEVGRGHTLLMKGGASFAPLSNVEAKLAEGLRAKFDPKGILNPGRMG